jgi:hypothetical protein
LCTKPHSLENFLNSKLDYMKFQIMSFPGKALTLKRRLS